ncbi:LysR family transcriptional regulator [bacterium]|nr:LysR family transcriptional regulator [bacterium]MCI0601564.1 LysR family transcriptional regulator [bacterium]
MNLEIRHLKLIEAIANEGSMTKASQRLHVTQPALSHQLKEIEDRLNAPLFLRLNRKLILTEAGEQLLSSARRVLQELELTEQNIRKLANGEQGVLRISTQCNTCYQWLPSLLKAMQQKFPGVEVEIVLEATYRPLEFLLAGKLDLAIMNTKVQTKNLSCFPLFEDELLVVMEPDNVLASRPYILPRDFVDQSLMVYAVPAEESLVFQRFLRPAGIRPKRTYKVALTEAMVEMVRAGMGIAVMARWAVASYLKSRELIGVRLTKNGVHRYWHAVTLNSKPTPTYYREFARLLSQTAVPFRSAKGLKLVI